MILSSTGERRREEGEVRAPPTATPGEREIESKLYNKHTTRSFETIHSSFALKNEI